MCAGEGALLESPSPSLSNEQRNLHKISSREKTKKRKRKLPCQPPAEKFARKRRGGVATGGRRDVGTDDGSPG